MRGKIVINKPPFRKLRGYAFDPITSLDLDTSQINQIVYQVPWEDLKPGPEGEYIKIIDRDPAGDAVYTPIDLDNPSILAMDGVAPSETNPQFHQQMVYAVMMTTIKAFEKAIGGKVMWSPVLKPDEKTKKLKSFLYPNSMYIHMLSVSRMLITVRKEKPYCSVIIMRRP